MTRFQIKSFSALTVVLITGIIFGLFTLSVFASPTVVEVNSISDTGQRLFYDVIGHHSDSSDDISVHLLDPDTTSKALDPLSISGDERISRDDSEYLDTRTLIKLHGIFMVVAWMGTTTIGVIIARWVLINDPSVVQTSVQSRVDYLQVLQAHLDQATILWHPGLVLRKFTIQSRRSALPIFNYLN